MCGVTGQALLFELTKLQLLRAAPLLRKTQKRFKRLGHEVRRWATCLLLQICTSAPGLHTLGTSGTREGPWGGGVAAAVLETKIMQGWSWSLRWCCIRSCTGGEMEDFQAAARLLQCL